MTKDLIQILKDLDLDEVGRVKKIHQLYQSVLSGIQQEKVNAKMDTPMSVQEIYPAIALQCLVQIRVEHDRYLELHPEEQTKDIQIAIELYEDSTT